MKTDDLIGMLATDAGPVNANAVTMRIVLSVVFAALLCTAIMVPWLGLRPDLSHAVAGFAFWWKQAFALALVIAGLIATLRLSRPGMSAGRTAMLLLFVSLAALWAVSAYLLFDAAPDTRETMIKGWSWTLCTRYIATLSIPAFVVTLWAMRGLAPTRLRVAGASAGLLSGAVAAAVYCLHCPEVAPPFVAIWYVLGVALPTALGAIIGPYVLRW
jgi:hypothetical protein